MGKRWRRTGKAAGILAAAYLVFALLANILPYLGGAAVSPEAMDRFAREAATEGSGADRVGLIETPVEAFGVRLAVVQEARDTLDIVCHTVQSGSTTDAFWGEVLLAADRGVQVRILLDAKAGTMNRQVAKKVGALSAHQNIAYRQYNPIHPLKPWEWEVLLHDKFIAADSRLLILGGRNLGDRYYDPPGREESITYDRDVLVWRTGYGHSALEDTADYMDLLWDSEFVRDAATRPTEKRDRIQQSLRSASTAFREDTQGYYPTDLAHYQAQTVPTNRVRLLHNPIHTGKKEPWVAYQMAQAALEAQERVQVQTPYATANPEMLATLSRVADNVSDPVMVTNSMASSPNYPAYSNYYSRRDRFAATGFRIYEYQSADSIHGKSMVVDDYLSFVGSMNLDDRSFFIDTETMLAIDSEEFAAVLLEAMDDLTASSLMVNAQGDGYVPDPWVEEESVSGGKVAVMWVVSVFSRLVQFLI